MRFSTELLYNFIRATRAGEASPEEIAVQVPPIMLPVFEARGALTGGMGASGSTVAQRQSFGFDVQSLFAPSAAAVNELVVCTFASGMWLLIVTLNVDSDFSDAVGSSRGSVGITPGVAPIVQVFFWIAARLIANTRNPPTTLYIPLLIPDDGWQLLLNHSATGVAQNSAIRVSGIALKQS